MNGCEAWTCVARVWHRPDGSHHVKLDGVHVYGDVKLVCHGPSGVVHPSVRDHRNSSPGTPHRNRYSTRDALTRVSRKWWADGVPSTHGPRCTPGPSTPRTHVHRPHVKLTGCGPQLRHTSGPRHAAVPHKSLSLAVVRTHVTGAAAAAATTNNTPRHMGQ